MSKESSPHISVMLEEFLTFFSECKIDKFFEGTVGAGGHAFHLLTAHPEIHKYIGCDRDPVALAIAGDLLSAWKEDVELVHDDYRHLDKILDERGVKDVDGFFFDLGVSSMQFDLAEKGFSFSKEGPLDMRMDQRMPLTAEEIINRWPEKKLAEIFRDYGEEPRWRRAAHAIVEARRKQKIKTTTALASVIVQTLGRSKKTLHPATLIFQALRIAVNEELEALKEGLLKAIERLSSGGRIGVISFHRLEDRIVKEFFKSAEREKRCRLLTKKPLVPTSQEIRRNPRARSAKMRFAEKI